MPVNDWLPLMPATITYEPATPGARDQYGKVTAYGAVQTFRARVNYRSVSTRNQFNGQDWLAAGECWVAGVINVGPDDRITLPGGAVPLVVDSKIFSDQNGPHHTRILFGGRETTNQR